MPMSCYVAHTERQHRQKQLEAMAATTSSRRRPEHAPIPWHRAVKQLAGGSISRGPTMSLVQTPPIQITQFKNSAPDVDLEGGQLLDVEEHEELDTDGWRQQVYTYRILSSDGSTEITKTIRRKIKLDCTSMVRRLEVKNGIETAVEEKCERVRGDIRGLGPVQSIEHNRTLRLDPNDVQDRAIYDVLGQVPETFRNMLSREQESIVKMFPELFSQMRTKSSLIPSTNTDVITNPDGSTTTRTRSSKSYSQSFSSQETYINGVRQENMSKTRYRAFVEYKGPDCGFRVKLSDNSSEDLSEDENEEDDRVSRTHSEITDTESELLPLHPPARLADDKKRFDKAWFAAKELVDSEARYVDKLRLLDQIFRKRVVEEKILDKERQNRLFANLASLYKFHNMHFLPQLMEASRDWHSTRRIANVVEKQAPFLKMYSEYTNNYERAMNVYEEAKKKKKFAEVVAEIEKLPDCEGLPLSHHLICPVQRVMRYQLLLQEYKKHLNERDADYIATAKALTLVLQAATHANEMMKKLEGFGKVIEVQEELGNTVSLVSPGRELLRRGNIQKISSTTEKAEDRHLVLFSDLILLASERRIGMTKYKLRAIFDPCRTQVCEGDNLEREHTFYIRGSEGSGPQRCIELFCESQKEKTEWMEALCAVIDDCRANSATFTGSQRSSLCDASASNSESKNCADCDGEFSFLSRGIRCGKCRRKLCKKCFGRYRSESKSNRICEACIKNTDVEMRRSHSTVSSSRQNLLAVPASGEGVLHGGWVKFRGSQGKALQRYFVVRNDFCLYSYKDPSDPTAVAMLPLPGAEVQVVGEPCTFRLRGNRRQYYFTVDTEEQQTHWMALLDLAANAQLRQQ